jgi:hypothetical protein
MGFQLGPALVLVLLGEMTKVFIRSRWQRPQSEDEDHHDRQKVKTTAVPRNAKTHGHSFNSSISVVSWMPSVWISYLLPPNDDLYHALEALLQDAVIYALETRQSHIFQRSVPPSSTKPKLATAMPTSRRRRTRIPSYRFRLVFEPVDPVPVYPFL